MTSRGAAFDDEIGNLSGDFFEGGKRSEGLEAETFSVGVRVIAAEADAVVVIDFEVSKMVIAKEVDQLPLKKILNPWVIQIPETSGADGEGKAIPLQEMVGFEVAPGFGIADLELKPNSGNETELPDFLTEPGHAVGEFVGIDDPVAIGLHFSLWRALGPTIVDDEVADAGTFERFGEGNGFIMAGRAPVGTPLVENDGQTVFAGWRRGEKCLLEANEGVG